MKRLCYFCVFLFGISFLQAQKNLYGILQEFVQEPFLNTLINENKVEFTRYAEKDMSPKLVLKTSLADRITRAEENQKFSPVFIMENLYLTKKETEKPQDISKILRSVSTLEGLQYYSHSRGAMRLLYKTSHAVAETKNFDGKTVYEKIPDPIDAEDDGLTVLVRQEDLTFGNYIYENKYFQDNKNAGMICTNTETLKYSIFKVIPPRNLKVSLIIQDIGDYLLIYACTQANFTKLPGIEKKLRNSFSSRAEAMYQWFINQYNTK